jgi:antitoxin ParD1/3/4
MACSNFIRTSGSLVHVSREPFPGGLRAPTAGPFHRVQGKGIGGIKGRDGRPEPRSGSSDRNPRGGSGGFASVEESARQPVDEALVARAVEASDDMAGRNPALTKPWPRSRGEDITREEHKARNAPRLAALPT